MLQEIKSFNILEKLYFYFVEQIIKKDKSLKYTDFNISSVFTKLIYSKLNNFLAF